MTLDAAPDPTMAPLRAADHARYEAALKDVRSRIGATYGLLIGGEEVPAHRLRAKHSPMDRGLVLGHFATATEVEVGVALAAAQAAFPAWAATSESDRRGVVRRLLVQLEARAFELAAVLSLEAGKTRREALREVWGTTELISAYCDEWAGHGFVPENAGRTGAVRMVPHGVWTVFAPFHHPLALGAGPAAAALLAGNTVVLKSAEETSWASHLVAEMMRDAGVPKGVFNLISGAPKDMGDSLFREPRIAGTTFTGSIKAGASLSLIMRMSQPPRPCIAEFTVKGARVVTASADLDAAAASIVRAAFGLTGQRASAPSHLIVHQDVADALAKRLTTLARTLRVGDPTLRETDVGPLVSGEDHADYRQVAHLLHEHGARVIFGGEVLSEHGLGAGNFVAPTLAEVPTDEHPCWERDRLLPVLMMRRYRAPDRALLIIRELKRARTVRVHGNAEDSAWFTQAFAAAAEQSDAHAPAGATSAWPSLQASMRAEEEAAEMVPALRAYLSQYLRTEKEPVTP